MNPEHYKLVFSVADCGYKAWWFPAAGLGFIFGGIFVIPLINKFSWHPWSPAALGAFRIFWVGFAILWTIFVFLSTFGDYRDARSTLSGGAAGYVAGPVEHFVPMPVGGHAEESFDVDGVPFHYSDYTITAGFNNATSHGGPIYEGLPVHIWYENKGGYTGNEILKLEIAEN